MNHQNHNQIAYQATDGLGYSHGAVSSPVKEVTLIRDALSTNEQALTELHQMIGGLEARLETILTPIGPASGAQSGQTMPQGPPKSHFQERVVQANIGVIAAIDRLRDLHSRIEL